MLARPRPADQEQDVQAGLAALAESDERISCQDIRKTLGLALTPRPVGSITLQGADL